MEPNRMMQALLAFDDLAAAMALLSTPAYANSASILIQASVSPWRFRDAVRSIAESYRASWATGDTTELEDARIGAAMEEFEQYAE